jgi:protein phosphatase
MPTPRLALECSATCDRGSGPARNEDQFLMAELARSVLVHETSLPQADHSRIVGRSQGTLLVVAAGAGTAGSGAVASTVAVDAVTGYVLNAMPWLCRLESGGTDDVLDALDDALVRCRSAVRAAGVAGDAVEGSVALTMAFVIGTRAYVVHLGRTSGYLWRPPALRRITHAHGAAAFAGGEARPPDSPWRRLLWPTEGRGAKELEPEVVRVDLEPGDALLLCSPGLTRAVPDARIVEELSVPLPLGRGAELCRRLAARARETGSTDDATVVLARARSARERRRAPRSAA